MVQKDLPLKHVLYNSGFTKRLTKWALELYEFEVSFEERKVLKA